MKPRAIILAILLCFCLLGCTWRPDAKAAKVNLEYWNRLGPYAKAGIDADASLNKDSKRIRKRSVDAALEHAKAMKEASKQK